MIWPLHNTYQMSLPTITQVANSITPPWTILVRTYLVLFKWPYLQASHLWVELRSRLIEKKGIFRHSPSPITYLLVDYYAHIFKQSIDLMVVHAAEKKTSLLWCANWFHEQFRSIMKIAKALSFFLFFRMSNVYWPFWFCMYW